MTSLPFPPPEASAVPSTLRGPPHERLYTGPTDCVRCLAPTLLAMRCVLEIHRAMPLYNVGGLATLVLCTNCANTIFQCLEKGTLYTPIVVDPKDRAAAAISSLATEEDDE